MSRGSREELRKGEGRKETNSGLSSLPSSLNNISSSSLSGSSVGGSDNDGLGVNGSVLKKRR